jgi:pimeloyl-ACP methyl ester carboxylesterase
VLLHGIACHREFMAPQVHHLRGAHRVVAVDLRGHGESDAPPHGYAISALADDVGWMCDELGIRSPVVIGHSLGGLVALELAAVRPELVEAVVMIDSVLLPGGDRQETIARLVAGIRGPHGGEVLHDYFQLFFSGADDPATRDWILDQAVAAPADVISSIWEESLHWDDARALEHCRARLLYIDAGTPNSDLARAAALLPRLVIGRTIGSGHFSQLGSAPQVNAMIDRFIALAS